MSDTEDNTTATTVGQQQQGEEVVVAPVDAAPQQQDENNNDTNNDGVEPGRQDEGNSKRPHQPRNGRGDGGARALNPHKIYVKDIPTPASEEEIKEFFSRAGEVTDLMIREVKSNPNVKYAFVGFSTKEAMEAALGFSGQQIAGAAVTIEPKQDRVCFKCNKAGHVAAACREAQRTCRTCGKPGHIAKDCRKGGFRDSQPVGVVSNKRGADRDVDRRRGRDRSRSHSRDRRRRDRSDSRDYRRRDRSDSRDYRRRDRSDSRDYRRRDRSDSRDRRKRHRHDDRDKKSADKKPSGSSQRL